MPDRRDPESEVRDQLLGRWAGAAGQRRVGIAQACAPFSLNAADGLLPFSRSGRDTRCTDFKHCAAMTIRKHHWFRTIDPFSESVPFQPAYSSFAASQGLLF